MGWSSSVDEHEEGRENLPSDKWRDIMMENSNRCIYRTNTKPVFMEVCLRKNETLNEPGRGMYIFRIYGLNRKGSSVPNIVEFIIPSGTINHILEIAQGAKNESMFSVFRTNEYTRRLSYNNRIEEMLGTDRAPGEEMLSNESLERAFFCDMLNNRSRRAYLHEIQYQNPEDEEHSLSACVFTIDFHLLRDNGEPAQKPWVFSIRELKKKLLLNESEHDDYSKDGQVWVAEKPVELYISDDQLQELAEAIEENRDQE